MIVSTQLDAVSMTNASNSPLFIRDDGKRSVDAAAFITQFTGPSPDFSEWTELSRDLMTRRSILYKLGMTSFLQTT
jgi:hypothetical protein